MSDLPAILDEFDLEVELNQIRTLLPTLSNGFWTDTSNADPGMVAIRLSLQKIQEWLYGSSVRYLPDNVALKLPELLGMSRKTANKARGIQQFIVGANTTIQAGFQVADETTGEVLATRTAVSSVAGGTVTVEAEAINAGPRANTRDTGRYTGIRSSPSAGTVLATSNQSAVSGGREAETVAEFKARFKSEISNTNLKKLDEFERKALENSAVSRAKAYRALMPFGAAGVFAREAGRLTLVLMSTGGGAPVQSVLDAVRDAIFDSSDFNLEDADPNNVGLYVLGVRARTVGVNLNVIAKPQFDLAVVKTAAEAAIVAYLHPLTGGQDGAGFAIGGSAARIGSEVIWALEGVPGLDYVLRESVNITGAGSMAIDEVVSAGTVSVTVAYA